MFLKDTRKFKDSTKRADKFAEGCERNGDLKATRCLEKLHSATGNKKMKEDGSQMAGSAKREVHRKGKGNDSSSHWGGGGEGQRGETSFPEESASS